MSWTKLMLIEEAYGELALASYVFDLTDEELQAGGRRLETMMALWDSQGLRLGYSFSSTPDDIDLSVDAGLQGYVVEAVFQNLAIRIAGGKGKSLPASTVRTAKFAYDALVSRIAVEEVQEQQLIAGVPRGAGAKPWRTVNEPFLQRPNTAPLRNSSDDGLTFTGPGTT